MAKVTKTNARSALADGCLGTSSQYKTEYTDPAFALTVDTDDYTRGRRKFIRLTLNETEALYLYRSLANFIVRSNDPKEILAMTATIIKDKDLLPKAAEVALAQLEAKRVR